MPTRLTWPTPPTSPAGTLLGASVPRRRIAVPDALAVAHSAHAREQAAAELGDRFEQAGGLQEVPVKRRAAFGATPTQQVRRVFVAKFNPAESDPTMGRFRESDPAAYAPLWNFHGPVECWVSDQPGHTRTTPAHSVIAPGDLIFVYRSQPKINGEVLVNPEDPLHGRPHLLGVWWAVRVHRRLLARPTTRPVTDVWHAPLVQFDDPVDVPVIRRHPELQVIAPFTDRRRATLVGASPIEAAALVAACSLPSYVLTDPDPVSIASRLAKFRTGMRPDDLRYARDARARYEYIHAIETAARDRVERDLVAAGWSVISRERCPRWGADLDCRRRHHGQTEERREVEVKGKRSAQWHDVVLQRAQYNRARQSALAADGVWWLAVCCQALHTPPAAVLELPADWVAQHWLKQQVR
jgi:hypothetical protein